MHVSSRVIQTSRRPALGNGARSPFHQSAALPRTLEPEGQNTKCVRVRPRNRKQFNLLIFGLRTALKLNQTSGSLTMLMESWWDIFWEVLHEWRLSESDGHGPTSSLSSPLPTDEEATTTRNRFPDSVTEILLSFLHKRTGNFRLPSLTYHNSF